MSQPHDDPAVSISRQPEHLDRLVESLCPPMLGCDEVKEALLYLLVGGLCARGIASTRETMDTISR